PPPARGDRGRRAGGAVDRRDRQDGPGVRGDAAGGPVRLPDLDPGAGRDRGPHASDRCPHLEQLARADRGAQARCLYLWLDYPSVEREMEIVRLHAPDIDERLARRLVEVVHMVRQLDLKKPPSIAESIDWARALILLGAGDLDRSVFERTMSIIVKHRSDMDLVAERVGVKLAGPLQAEAG